MIAQMDQQQIQARKERGLSKSRNQSMIRRSRRIQNITRCYDLFPTINIRPGVAERLEDYYSFSRYTPQPRNPSLFPNLLGTSSSARVEFYDKFQREAYEYDRDFMKKYDEDLNTTLIFVSLDFVIGSATAFIRFLGWCRPVRSPQWLLLSSLTLRITSNRTFKK